MGDQLRNTDTPNRRRAPPVASGMVARPGATPFYTQAVADAGGSAEIKIEVDEAALPDSSLLVQASYDGRTATRKFILRKAE